MNMLSGQNDPLSNPCVRNCCLNEQDVCLGCFRHLDEILAWRSMSEEERCGCYVKMVERRGIQQAKWTSQK
ncbi:MULTISPECIES: DUF1289 domain-containing protein [Shewanella]|uniref:DUF1289 domain-containing protein n=2 Tax=Shewanella putrefaciens TaxID=24 RepID=E6XGK9_SHEP2|nr:MULTISPECIES: DUF1289 domain-containing protein [Shewanella]ABM25356.1 protein of unknown function DUF1289 [Shewanella sp. W3-18-1]QGS50268.1 DUF1289 domain-containing protein [Shewanella putrefaciens]